VAMIPAIRATASTSPLGTSPERIRSAADVVTRPLAVAVRVVTSRAATSTIRAWPASSRWVRSLMTDLPVGAYCAVVDEVRAIRWPAGSTVVVLTGGASRRLGRDKATAHVGGHRLVDRILADVPLEVPVVVVGPPLGQMARPACFVQEEPPGSGPLAGIGAGLAQVSTPLVGVIAADMPFAVPVVAGALSRLAGGDPSGMAVPGMDRRIAESGHTQAVLAAVGGLVPVDPSGFWQPLCAAYRTDALRRALEALGPLAGLPVRALQQGLDVVQWRVPAAALADVDTAEQLAAARTRAAQEEGRDMQEWVDAVRAALGVDVALDIDAILDVARDAAHGVDRPAAPVTTYLLGAAVAAGADPGHAAAVIGELARGWGTREG
jgi:molybdopterin-guanine dinucleotide biosynthesis protein A